MSVSNRRLENRLSQNLRLSPVGCTLVCPSGKVPLEVVNYHYRGACFKVPSGDFRVFEKNSYLQFRIGIKDLTEKILFRIVWETISENGSFGVEFTPESSFVLARSERFIVNRINSPVISCTDPLDPNRFVYMKVENISNTGMLLSTSLTNKHLFPGMELRGALLTIPNVGKTEVDLFIENSRPTNNDLIHFGVSLKGSSHNYHSLIAKYLSNLASHSDSEDRIEKLHSANFIQKELRKHLTIREIKTEKEYQSVLKLRFDGYRKAGKVDPNKDWNSMGQGLSEEGIVLGAFLGGQMIASCEVRLQHIHGTRLLKKFKVQQIPGLRSENLFEINKLVVHPRAQKTDVVLGLIQKIHSLVMLNGAPDGLISADDKLVPLYERIGFKRTGIRFPHPIKTDTNLNILILYKETYLDAKGLNSYAWSLAYEDLQHFYQNIGVNNNTKFNSLYNLISKKVLETLSTTIGKFQKKRASKESNNESNSTLDNIPIKSVVDPRWTKPHLNVNVMLPYILEACDMIETERVQKILLEFGFDMAYFKKSSNWVSVEFFDTFIDKFSEYGDITLLNKRSGFRNISKDVLGPNFYIIKHFFSPGIAFKTFEKYVPKLNKTIHCKVIDHGIDYCRIRIDTIDESMISKHSSVIENWLSFSEAYVLATTKKSANIQLLKNIYAGDDCIEYIVKWQNPLFSKIKALGAIALACLTITSINIIQFFVPTEQLKHYAIGAFSLFAVMTVLYKYRKAVVRYNEIHDSFTEYEKQADEKYKELQNSKTILEKGYQEGKLLEKIQKEIQVSDDTRNTLNLALESLCTQFDFKRSFIMIKDEAENLLRTCSVYGEDQSISNIWNFKVDIKQKRDNPLVLSSSFHSGQSILINNVEEHKNQLNAASRQLIEKLETPGFAIVPIPSENQNWGVLVADKGKSSEIISRRDLIALQRIAQSIGLALDKQAKVESEIKIRQIFQKFVPSAVVESTLGQKEFKLGGETKEAICLFLDIRNFTSLSSKIPATILVDILNKIFTLLQTEVTAAGGVIDKYLGDGALVTWGAIPGSNHDPMLSLECAKRFLYALDNLNEEFIKSGLDPIEVGIGIHKGPVIAGNIGSNDRAEFTVIGSTVNLASRLEQLTKVLKCHVVVTENLVDFANLDSSWKIHDSVQVRGLDGQIKVASYTKVSNKNKSQESA